MENVIAFCGLDCAHCEAYIATQANDRPAQERLLTKWRTEYGNPEMDLSAVTCDGCTSCDGRLGGYCSVCPVRACAVEHGVKNCAHCTDYECEKLADFLAKAPEAWERLQSIRHLLQ